MSDYEILTVVLIIISLVLINDKNQKINHLQPGIDMLPVK